MSIIKPIDILTQFQNMKVNQEWRTLVKKDQIFKLLVVCTEVIVFFLF